MTKAAGIRIGLIAGLAVYALSIHAAFIRHVPDPLFSPDSVSYAQPAVSLFYGHGFPLNAERTPAYSLFLYAALALTRRFLGVLLIQHGLALASGLWAGLLYYRFFRPSWVGAALVAFLSSSLPLPALYAHYILTETLYGFWVIAVLWFVLQAGRDRRAWIASGLSAACAALTRPVGRSLLVVIGAAPLIQPQRARVWRGAGIALVSAAALLLLDAAANRVRYGFFGLDRMKNEALFCTTARYLDVRDIDDARVRDALRPIFARHTADLADGSFIYGAADGPVKALQALYPPPVLDALYGRLARQAIARAPFAFLRDRLIDAWHVAFDDAAVPRYFLLPEAAYFAYQGLNEYAEIAGSDPRAWTLMRYGPAEAQTYFSQLHFVPTGRPSGQLPLLPESAGDRVYHYDRVLRMWAPFSRLWGVLRVLPYIAFLAALVLLRDPRTRPATALLLLTVAGHAAASGLAAWHDARFAVPMLPLYWILLIAGIQVKSTSA